MEGCWQRLVCVWNPEKSLKWFEESKSTSITADHSQDITHLAQTLYHCSLCADSLTALRYNNLDWLYMKDAAKEQWTSEQSSPFSLFSAVMIWIIAVTKLLHKLGCLPQSVRHLRSLERVEEEVGGVYSSTKKSRCMTNIREFMNIFLFKPKVAFEDNPCVCTLQLS